MGTALNQGSAHRALPCCGSSGLLRFGALFPELLDLFVDIIREAQLAVEVAARRIVRRRADREILLRLPFENALALGRTIVAPLHLQHERARILLALTR